MDINRLFINLEDIPLFNSFDELSAFLKDYNKLKNLKGFGKEIQHLYKKEYRYDVSKNIFIKKI